MGKTIYGYCGKKGRHEVLAPEYKGTCHEKGKTIDTGVSINGGYGGKTYLIAYSYHTSDGNNTGSGISLLRCGFDGNKYEITPITSSRGEDGEISEIGLTFGVSAEGTLTFQNGSTGASRVSIIPLT